MKEEQLKARIKELLAAPVLTGPILDELHALVLGPKKPARAKTASTSTDRQTVANLREQVANLKKQLEPAKATDDDLIDQLYVKTVERTYEIEMKGSPVTFGTSERQHKALKVSANAYYLAPGTPLTIGTEMKSGTSSDCIVTAIKHVAGRIEVTTFNPDCSCQSYKETKTVTGNNLSKDGTSISCKLDGDKLIVFGRRYPANTILKLGEAFYFVEGSYQEGLLATHKLKPYTGIKTVAPMQGERRPVDNTVLPKNWSMYHNQIM